MKVRWSEIIVCILVIAIIVLIGWFIQKENFKDKNCVDASSECKEFFSKLGIKSRMVWGSRWDENGTRICHCWLEVDNNFLKKMLLWTVELECRSLKFKDVSSEYKIDWKEE